MTTIDGITVGVDDYGGGSMDDEMAVVIWPWVECVWNVMCGEEDLLFVLMHIFWIKKSWHCETSWLILINLQRAYYFNVRVVRVMKATTLDITSRDKELMQVSVQYCSCEWAYCSLLPPGNCFSYHYHGQFFFLRKKIDTSPIKVARSYQFLRQEKTVTDTSSLQRHFSSLRLHGRGHKLRLMVMNVVKTP